MNEDLIFKKLIEMDAKLNEVATNGRVNHLETRIMDALDKQTVILQRLD